MPRCPYCCRTFDKSTLDMINSEVETSYEKPDKIIHDWHFFFRGYLPSFENSILVGCALAWNPNRKGVYYGCVPGGEPFSYTNGEVFPRPYGWLTAMDFSESGLKPFIDGKNDALQKLINYVELMEFAADGTGYLHA